MPSTPADDFARLIPLFQVLDQQAAADNDPATYASLIEDNAERVAGAGVLERILTYPDLQDRVERAYAPAALHREWWTELLSLLRNKDDIEPASGPERDNPAD